VTVSTGTVSGNFEKVTTLDNKIVWFDTVANTVSGTAPTVAAGDILIPCDTRTVKQVWCDDTTGDGSVVVEFCRVFVYEAGASTPLMSFDFKEDGTTPYTIQGNNPDDIKQCSGGETEVVLIPGCANATNASPVIIPANVKSYSISNLGENGAGCVFDDIVITGDITYTMLSAMKTYGDGVNEDQDSILPTGLTITPAAGHIAAVCWKF